MKNTALLSPFHRPTKLLIGMPAETTSDEHIPNSSDVVGNFKSPIQRRKRGVLVAKIPYYVRNNEPNLREFSIF